MSARRLTDDEKKHYIPEFRERMFICTGTHIALDNPLLPEDFPSRESDGCFPANSNQAWIITQEEWEYYLDLDHTRTENKLHKEQEEELLFLRQEIERMNRQPKLYSSEEAKHKAQEWNETYNEGGEGYIPHFYTIEEFKRVSARIAELENILNCTKKEECQVCSTE